MEELIQKWTMWLGLDCQIQVKNTKFDNSAGADCPFLMAKNLVFALQAASGKKLGFLG
ncbi:MAG: hypothetical protein Fur0022_30890 [Anaerolineales bacterium]